MNKFIVDGDESYKTGNHYSRSFRINKPKMEDWTDEYF